MPVILGMRRHGMEEMMKENRRKGNHQYRPERNEACVLDIFQV